MINQLFDIEGKRIYVAGHTGLLGHALFRRLTREKCNMVLCHHSYLELRAQDDVLEWFANRQPDVVIIAAGTVGGVLGNMRRPADFLYDNLMIQANIIEACRLSCVQKVVILGSSCIYPREAEQPIKESALLTGPLEPTNEWYAVAKIAGVKLGQAYRRQYDMDCISVMPCNLYGHGDHFDERGHVISSMIRKFHDAKESGASSVTLWGTGTPLREFLYVDDAADGIVHFLKHYSHEEPINLGRGVDLSISHLADIVANVVGFQGEIRFNPTMPDGVPRKLLCTEKATALGWQARTSLIDGLHETYRWFQENP